MRLIDADELNKRFKKHYDFFVSAYKNEQDMSLANKLRVDEILNSIAEVTNAPTICDIEQIRAEIQSNFENSTEPTNNIDAMLRNIGREECLEVIDKYTRKESK